MAQTVAEFTIDRLGEWGIKQIFGYPGDGINGFMSALRKSEDKMRFIQSPHEEICSFIACGYAKFTGEVSVCMATSGPGAIHLLNGLYDAKMDHQPVVAIIGQQARAAIGGSYQQEVDLLSLFKDVASDYVQIATEPSQVRHLVDRAVRIAKVNRTVTCIIFPNDLQEESYTEPKRIHGTVHSGVGYTTAVAIPHRVDLEKAANILNEGKKVAILVGAGAAGAAKELMQIADILGAGIAKALLGKDVLPDDLPYVTGSIGILGTAASWDLMEHCDTLFMIGSSFPYSEYLPKEGSVRGVQIDIDGKMLGLRYPMELNLQGDSKATLKELIPLLKRKDDRSWRERIEKNMRKWWDVIEARANTSADPINPQYVFWELSKRLPGNAILSADSGTAAIWYARDIKMREGMRGTLSGGLATMCPAIPYAIAAKIAYPQQLAVALLGDGAMQMLGINALIMVANQWRSWANPKMIIVVLNNRDLNMVTWEQRIMVGDAKFNTSQDVADFPYDEYARMLGLEGIRITKPADLPAALDRALEVEKPVVLNVYTDPSVPLLPPHITFDQMKSFASAVLKGDSDAWNIIKQTTKEMLFAGKS